MTLDQAVPLWRERSKLTPSELAHVVGVTRQHVYQWEKGMRLPTLEALPLLAKALGRTFPDLLEVWLQSELLKRGVTASVAVHSASLSAA